MPPRSPSRCRSSELCNRRGPVGEPWFPYDASVHVALQSPDRATVDAFHQAAVAAGGTDNGAPGIPEHYHAHYYGAYVHDPDGNNIEAVCHAPE